MKLDTIFSIDNAKTNLDFALAYAEKGWHVFPLHSIRNGQCSCGDSQCKNRGKHPRTEHGHKEATTNTKQIIAWWQNTPDANIGVRTGKESGISALDIDPGKGGSVSIQEFVVPETLRSNTGGDGIHHVFQYDENIPTKTRFRKGVDFRSDGGYFVAPPSNHISGKNYVWCNEFLNPAPAPDWMKVKNNAEISQRTKFKLPEEILEGERNSVLFSFACSLSALGKQEDEILSKVTNANQERCEEPLSDSEIATIVKGACSYDRPGIQVSSSGKVKKTLLNIVNIFNSDPNLIGIFYANLFDGSLHYSRTPFWNREIKPEKRLDDDDMVFVKHYLGTYHSVEPSIFLISEAAIIVGHQSATHPVREYLNSLIWDGKERLKNWLTIAAGVEENLYSCCVGLKTLVGAVARVFVPGIKFDCMLILEGLQGLGKSALVQIMGDKWYVPVSLTDTDKDTIDTMLGAWIIENEEMVCFSRQDVERLKAFLSRQSDRVRLSYERRSKDFPRQSIFIGTMNPVGDKDYLRDSTGNRRFWPVVCTKAIDRDWLINNRDQLFAEAVQRFKNGEKLWIDDPKVNAMVQFEQEMRQSKDPWTYNIASYLSDPNRTEVSLPKILASVLEIPIGKVTKSEQTRIGIIMKQQGWERRFDKERKCSIYCRPNLPNNGATNTATPGTP